MPKITHTYIKGADEDPFADMGFDKDEELEEEPINEEENLENEQEDEENEDEFDVDIEEDDIQIGSENNISDHFIAECDNCHGVFITSIEQTDEIIESISGICPLCEKESDQHLNWVIKDVD